MSYYGYKLFSAIVTSFMSPCIIFISACSSLFGLSLQVLTCQALCQRKVKEKTSCACFDLINLFSHQLLVLSKVPSVVRNKHRFDRMYVVFLNLRILSVSGGLRTDLESVRGVSDDLLSQSCVVFCC